MIIAGRLYKFVDKKPVLSALSLNAENTCLTRHLSGSDTIAAGRLQFNFKFSYDKLLSFLYSESHVSIVGSIAAFSNTCPMTVYNDPELMTVI